jgi:F0F1-type ATP synthase delta subunit
MYRTSKIVEKQIEISRQLAILLKDSLITCEIYRSIDEHFVEIQDENMETSNQILKLMLELRELGVILKQLDEYKKEFNKQRATYIGMVGTTYPSIAYETLRGMKANYIEMGGDELDLPALSPPNNYGRAPIN